MNNKTIIVTGGSRGIGKAIVGVLLKEGYDVYSCDRKVFNLSDRKAIENFCNTWNKPLYGLVNNAGICKTEKLSENFNVWDDVIDTNLNGAYFLTKGLIKHFIDNGRIVNISSQLGKEGRAGYGAYCASKFGIIGLTKCWAKELGGRGITVNAICPGWVKTEMAMKDLKRMAEEKGVSSDELYEEICKPLELKRFTEPEEVADLAAFLLSSKADGITGRAWLLNTIWNQE